MKMNEIGADCGRRVFGTHCSQFSKGFYPFDKISAYRDILLHNAVIGRAIDVQRTFIPKWDPDINKSPLCRIKKSWRAAEELTRDEWISTKELFDELIQEVCLTLDPLWDCAGAPEF